MCMKNEEHLKVIINNEATEQVKRWEVQLQDELSKFKGKS